MTEIEHEIRKSTQRALELAKSFIDCMGLKGMGIPIIQGWWTAFPFKRVGKKLIPKEMTHGPNGNTTIGLTSMLDAWLRNQPQPATWYIGLVNNSGWSAFSAADTASSHGGWTELTGSSYDESTRPAWTPNAASAGSITNTTTSDFTIGATVAIKGSFLISNSTKGGSTGTLHATGAFGSVQNLVDNDVLKVSYAGTLTPS